MYFNYKGNNLYYEKYGDSKKAIMIMPGWGDNRKTFSYIIKALQNEFSIYIFDYPGFGKSKIPNQDLTIYSYAELFIEFMKKNNIKKPIIIGHSFGGRVIITMNGYFNISFEKIILISSAGIKPKKNIIQKLKQNIYKVLKKLSLFIPLKHRKKYLNKLIKLFASPDYQALPPSLHKTFINIVNEDLTNYLKTITSETLLIWGENDESTPLKDGYKMNNLIKNSGLVVLKKTSHFCYIEKPYYIILIIKNFLNSN